jgi:hypothetical protein
MNRTGRCGASASTPSGSLHPPRARRPAAHLDVEGFDVAMLDLAQGLVDDTLTPGVRRYGLAEGGLELSRRGGHLEAIADRLDELGAAIVDGTIQVPRWPTAPVLPRPA